MKVSEYKGHISSLSIHEFDYGVCRNIGWQFQGKGVFGQVSYFMDQIRPEPLHTCFMKLARTQGLTLTSVLRSVSYELRANKKNMKSITCLNKKYLKLIMNWQWNSKWKAKSLSLRYHSKAKLEVKHKFSQRSRFRSHSIPLFPPSSQTRGWPKRRALKGN